MILAIKDGNSVYKTWINPELPKERIDQIIAGREFVEIDPQTLPHDDYQDAWTLENGTIGVDMTKAKDVYKDKIRLNRYDLFNELDKQFMLALEQGDSEKQADVVADKQYLRDITSSQDIENAETIDDLESLDLLSTIKTKYGI